MSARTTSGQGIPPTAPTAEAQPAGFFRPFVQRLHRFANECAWIPIAGKAAIGIGAFLALALVGSGKAMDLLPGGAGAYLGPPATAAPASAAPVADAGAMPPSQAPVTSPDGGAAEVSPDAGAIRTQDGAGSSGGSAGAGITPDGKVILNLATEQDLRKLPGIGPSKARAILTLRQKLGRFRRVEDLLRVKGIGRKSLGRLRPRLLLDPPP